MSNTNNWSFDYEDNTKDALIINALIFIIVIILFVVALFLIYARRRYPALRWLTMGGAEDAQTNTHEPPPKKGLDPSVIASLPTFVYKKSGRDDDPGAECAICLTDLKEEETARLLPNCNHVFHVECIDMWLHSNSTCPICRSGPEPSTAEEKEETALASESLESAEDAVEQSSKVGRSGSGLRLSSFRRMLSWERSDRRLQSDVDLDLERQ